MIMKQIFLYSITFFCILTNVNAQVDRQKKEVTINFGALKKKKISLEEVKAPEIELPDNLKLEFPDHKNLMSPLAITGLNYNSKLNWEGFGKLLPKQIQFGKKRDVQRYISRQQPKHVKEFEGGKPPIFANQDLGDVHTTSGEILILFKDYGNVDGDLIKMLVNDQVKLARVYLSGSFSRYKLKLKNGFNKIDFSALNMGLFPPNTARLKIVDDKGKTLYDNQWALSTGFKASMIVIKE